MDNSVAKVTLEKSWVHNHFIKTKICEIIIIGKQRKVNKCRTNYGKKLYIALCIVVIYINGKQVIYLYRNIYAITFKYISFKRTAMRQHHMSDETNKNKNIIRKAPIKSGIKHLCASRAQNDALEATLSHSAQAHSAYAHPVRRMMCLKQHWVTARRHTVLMRILCAEWCAWSNTESQRAGTQCLCASCAQNDVLEATLSHSAQAHSAYAHPVRRMMCLKQHWVTARRHTVLMRILCAEWCAWSNTESQHAGTQCLCASCAQNDVLEATLSHSAQVLHSALESH